MDALPLVLSSLSLLLQAAVLTALLRKQRDDSTEMQALGLEYARIAVAAAAGEKSPARVREVAIEKFRIVDASADGKRDFSDRQAGVFVDAILGAEKK